MHRICQYIRIKILLFVYLSQNMSRLFVCYFFIRPHFHQIVFNICDFVSAKMSYSTLLFSIFSFIYVYLRYFRKSINNSIKKRTARIPFFSLGLWLFSSFFPVKILLQQFSCLTPSPTAHTEFRTIMVQGIAISVTFPSCSSADIPFSIFSRRILAAS